MGVTGIPIEAGLGDRPFVPFFNTGDVAVAIPDPANAEALATAGMILSSLGLMRTIDPANLRPVVTRPANPYAIRRGPAARPIECSEEARVLDIDFVRAVALRPEGHASPQVETDYLIGMQRSLLDRGLEIRTVGRRVLELGGGVMQGLTHYSRHLVAGAAPSFQPERRTAAGGLSRLMRGVGKDRAVWLTREGGFPEAGLASDGVQTVVLIGGNGEKVKLHAAGNRHVQPTNGMNVEPESLFGVAGTVLHVAGQPIGDVMGTTIKHHIKDTFK